MQATPASSCVSYTPTRMHTQLQPWSADLRHSYGCRHAVYAQSCQPPVPHTPQGRPGALRRCALGQHGWPPTPDHHSHTRQEYFFLSCWARHHHPLHDTGKPHHMCSAHVDVADMLTRPAVACCGHAHTHVGRHLTRSCCCCCCCRRRQQEPSACHLRYISQSRKCA
jgi:hypothetical protein